MIDNTIQYTDNYDAIGKEIGIPKGVLKLSKENKFKMFDLFKYFWRLVDEFVNCESKLTE